MRCLSPGCLPVVRPLPPGHRGGGTMIAPWAAQRRAPMSSSAKPISRRISSVCSPASGRRRTVGAASGHRHGVAHDAELAERGVLHRRRHAEVADLRVGEHLVDRVHRAAGTPASLSAATHSAVVRRGDARRPRWRSARRGSPSGPRPWRSAGRVGRSGARSSRRSATAAAPTARRCSRSRRPTGSSPWARASGGGCPPARAPRRRSSSASPAGRAWRPSTRAATSAPTGPGPARRGRAAPPARRWPGTGPTRGR